MANDSGKPMPQVIYPYLSFHICSDIPGLIELMRTDNELALALRANSNIVVFVEIFEIFGEEAVLEILENSKEHETSFFIFNEADPINSSCYFPFHSRFRAKIGQAFFLSMPAEKFPGAQAVWDEIKEATLKLARIIHAANYVVSKRAALEKFQTERPKEFKRRRQEGALIKPFGVYPE